MTRWVCGIFLAVVLVGCSSQGQLTHSVSFDPGSTELGRVEWKELNDFVTSSTRICFELDGPRGGGGYFDPVTAARVAELTSYLSSLGHHATVPRQPFWTYDGPISISIRTCERKD